MDCRIADFEIFLQKKCLNESYTPGPQPLLLTPYSKDPSFDFFIA